MRKLIYIWLILLTAHSSYAQKIRFTDTSNTWGIMGYQAFPPSQVFGINFYKGLLSYKGHFYNTIGGAGYVGGEYFREDTSLNIVYVLKISMTDTNEKILYDYNMKLGDTIRSVSRRYNTVEDTFDSKVVKIDSALLNGYWNKIWTLKCIYSNIYDATIGPAYSIIEGIGSLNGFTYPLYPYNFENSSKTICFSNNNVRPVFNPPVGSFDNSQSCKLSVLATNNEPKSTTIIPNPANESSRVVFPYAIQQGRLLVTNAMGQVVLQKEFQQKEQLMLGAFPAEGLYIIQVNDTHNGNNFRVKFVYQ